MYEREGHLYKERVSASCWEPSTSEMLPWQPLLAGWVQGSLPPPQLVHATMSLGPAAAQPAGDASSTPPAPLFLAASVPCAHTQNQRRPRNLRAFPFLKRNFDIIIRQKKHKCYFKAFVRHSAFYSQAYREPSTVLLSFPKFNNFTLIED